MIVAGTPGLRASRTQRFLFLVTAFVGLVIVSCGPAHRGGFPVIRAPQKLTREDQATQRAQSYFVKALDYDRRNLQDIALRYYEMAYELDPDASVLRDILVSKYIAAGKNTQALLLVKGNRVTSELSNEDKRVVARIYLKMGKFNEAAALFEDIPDKTPEELYSLALVYEAKGASEKAIATYLAFLRLRPEAVSIGIKAGGLMLKNDNPSGAESLYVALKENNPDDPDLLTALGVLRKVQGDTAQASSLFNDAIRIDSTHEEAIRNAAQVEINREAYEKAAEYYQMLYSKKEGYRSMYGKTLAMLYYYNEDYRKAQELLHSLLEKKVHDDELHFYLGLVANAQGDSALATIEFEKTIALNPENTDAWRHLIFNYLRANQDDQALKVVQRFVGAQQESAVAWRILGSVHSSRKEYKKAENALLRAVELDSTDSQAWFDLGSAFERQGDIQKASDAFRRVLELRPKDPAASNYLGYMWAEAGMQLDSALALLENALAQDSANGAYLDSYAWIFYKMGQMDSAQVYIERAIEVLDNDPVVFEHLGDILVAQNETGPAIEAYEKSLELGIDDPERIRKKIETIMGKEEQSLR